MRLFRLRVANREPAEYSPLMAEIVDAMLIKPFITRITPRKENSDTIVAEIDKGISARSHYETRLSDRTRAINRPLNGTAADIVLIAGKGHENTASRIHTITFADYSTSRDRAIEDHP